MANRKDAYLLEMLTGYTVPSIQTINWNWSTCTIYLWTFDLKNDAAHFRTWGRKRTYMFQRREASPWAWSGVGSVEVLSMKAANVQNQGINSTCGTVWPICWATLWGCWQSSCCDANLKDDGGLLPWLARTVSSPNRWRCPSLGVNGRLVDCTRRDCLASLTISALVFVTHLRCLAAWLDMSCCFPLQAFSAVSGLCAFRGVISLWDWIQAVSLAGKSWTQKLAVNSG